MECKIDVFWGDLPERNGLDMMYDFNKRKLSFTQ